MSSTSTTTLPWIFTHVLPPIHLLSYSALLGTQLYQSFVVTGICFRALPRSAFTTLQRRIFPAYFRAQALLVLIVAATVPPYGPLSFVAWDGKGHDEGSRGGVAWSVVVPFVVAGVTAALNWGVYGPRTQRIMVERVHQETRDKKQALLISAGAGDVDGPSLEMRALNRQFSRNHAMSIHLNLLTIGAMIFWGCKLASKIIIV